jgi:hypothetical protein
LKPENIGNSRNTTFEKMVLENTAGKGVDYVLNSLSGDKLQASIRCLGIDGVFLEIGKYDIQMGTNLDMRFLSKRITIRAVIFDDLSVDSDEMQVKCIRYASYCMFDPCLFHFSFCIILLIKTLNLESSDHYSQLSLMQIKLKKLSVLWQVDNT